MKVEELLAELQDADSEADVVITVNNPIVGQMDREIIGVEHLKDGTVVLKHE
jgi:hypothetical protein